MKNLNSLAISLAVITFAAGWYLGGSNDALTITSSSGGESYSGGYQAEKSSSASSGAVKVRTTEGTTHIINPGDSIQAAVELALPGDTIQVMPGTYSETVYIDKDDIHLLGVIV
ncbi:cytochrome-c peroxidase, partial [Gammaproteobacteria bacterium]|nr:cytochrome-c peroxidase [Gammaproteobacteria bacterium]